MNHVSDICKHRDKNEWIPISEFKEVEGSFWGKNNNWYGLCYKISTGFIYACCVAAIKVEYVTLTHFKIKL